MSHTSRESAALQQKTEMTSYKVQRQQLQVKNTVLALVILHFASEKDKGLPLICYMVSQNRMDWRRKLAQENEPAFV